MPHPNDGSLLAWLDGELEPGEGVGVQEHMESCAECRVRVDILGLEHILLFKGMIRHDHRVPVVPLLTTDALLQTGQELLIGQRLGGVTRTDLFVILDHSRELDVQGHELLADPLGLPIRHWPVYGRR